MALAMGGCGNTSNPTGTQANDNTEEVAPEVAKSGLDKDTLVLGFDDTFAPMGFKDENGEVVGFDIDLAKAITEKMGKTIQFQTIDWSMKESHRNIS